MPTSRNYSYIFAAIFSVLLLCGSSGAFAQSGTDTTATDTVASNVKPKYVEKYGHQLCFAYDISRFVSNSLNANYKDNQFAIDYYLRKEIYLVVEAGWGNSNVDYTYLKYNTTNNFVSFGINKSIFKRAGLHDWDMGFVGVRGGMGFVQRSKASYSILDTVWSNIPITNTVAGGNVVDYWVGITGGMRVELVKNFFLGWTIRGKFLLSGTPTGVPEPSYVAGYGKGDKNSVFDFNFYLTYAIRWNRKNLSPESTKTQGH